MGLFCKISKKNLPATNQYAPECGKRANYLWKGIGNVRIYSQFCILIF